MVSASDLTLIRDEIGDKLYYDPNKANEYDPNKVYILKDGDTSNNPIQITDHSNTAYVYNDYSYDGYTSTTKAYAIESTTYVDSSGDTVEGYILAIKQEYGTEGNLETYWQTVNVDSSGQIDSSTWSYGSVINKEVEFGEDLNGDKVIGLQESALTLKTTDTVGEKLLVDAENNLYIKTVSGELLSVVDPYSGNPYGIDYESSWSDGSSKTETLKVTRWDNDTASDLNDDKYIVFAQSTYTYSGTTDVQNVMYKVELDGKIDWNSDWNPSLSDYEPIFNEDLNGDKIIGANLANIAEVSTDNYGVALRKDSLDGTLYLNKDNTDYKIKDEYGGTPSLEYESSYTYEGITSSYSSVAYAVEEKSDGTFCLAIKNTSIYGDQTDIYWNIYNLSLEGSNALLSWSNSNYSVNIVDYEKDFGQDLNGDGDTGFKASNLTAISSDNVGALLKKDSEGNVYIISESDPDTAISISDEYGYTPQLEYSYSSSNSGIGYDDYSYSYSSEAKAVTLIDPSDGSTDYYRLAVKNTDTYDGVTNINWQIYKISLEGLIDWTASVYTKSITTWEDEFGQDLNGDNDFSGSVSVSNYGNDTVGATLGKDKDGSLYIRDGETDILINDSYLENQSSWSDGSYSSTAVAATKNSEGYYQVAVKSTNTYTDYWSTGSYSSTGTQVTDSNWSIYGVDTSGNLLWDKYTWTESIGNFEIAFNQDLDEDGTTGIDLSDITSVVTDTFGWRLHKDENKGLYVADSDGNNLMALGDGYGPLNYDYEYNSDYYSYKSEAIAAEKNTDGTFTVVVKNSGSDSWDGNTNTWLDYQILDFSSSGAIDYSSYSWTQDIKAYETIFGQDLDGDQSIGLDLSNLTEITTDTTGAVIKKDSTGDNFYIQTLDDNLIHITESWGGSADLEYSSSWSDGSWEQKVIAAESISYTNRSDNTINGYVIAVKNTSTYSGENWTDWELKYTDSRGVIDWEMSTYTTSIKKSESLFGDTQDLDGDGYVGLSDASLTTVASDTVGASLLKDSEDSLYIKDGSTLILIEDEYGGTTRFDYSYSGGSDSTAYSYSSEAYAVEDFIDTDGNKKYLLAIKNTDTYGSEITNSWQTYNIIEKTPGNGDWYLDWMSSSWSKGISKKEEIFGQDLNNSGSVDSATNITTTAVSTDTSDGGVTGAQLCVDAEGSLYIKQGETKIAIVDNYGGSVNFDWKYSWGDYVTEAKSYAVEGIANSEGTAVDKYILAIKHTETNTSTEEVITNWETINISTTGVVDWMTTTWSDGSRYEKDLNQELDGVDGIWDEANVTTTQIDTDNVGVKVYLDDTANKNAYIKAPGEANPTAILDESGNLISFNNKFKYSNWETESSLYAATEVTVGSSNYYKLLIKHVDTDNSDSSNPVITTNWETINLSKTTKKIDWSTNNWYNDPKKLEAIFDLPELDGVEGIYTINSSDTTPVSTDIIGAQLRSSSDGSLFIQDGDTTLTVTSPDGGFVDFDSNYSYGTDSSYVTTAIAAEKVGSNYKIVVEEKYTYSGTTDTMYTVYTLDSNAVLDWKNISYRTATELNEDEFNQDINGIEGISAGTTSANDTYADLVSTGTTDAETLTDIQNTAQSDIYSITNADSTSADSKIEMYVEGIEGTAKGNYDIDVSIVQTANDSLIAKAAADTGLESTDFNALTGVMDFSVKIKDEDNFGKIVSMSWVLPDGTENPKYYKKDVVSGEYFDFIYDKDTGEGTQWDPTTNTLKVSVRDNGKYDSDSQLGVVKDPGFISSGKDTSAPVLSTSYPTSSLTTEVPNNANIDLIFSEKVNAQAGKYINIYKRSDNSLVEAIESTNTTLVSGNGTNKITINPTNDLALGTEYYILIDANAFLDKSSNAYAGIVNTGEANQTLQFKTAKTDLAPTFTGANIANSTSASHLSNLELSFSEAVTANDGNIVIYKKSNDLVVETIKITNTDKVSGSGTNKIIIDPGAELESGTQYYVKIDSNALIDSGEQSFAGISDEVTLTFTTSPYLFTSTSDDQVILNTGKSYSQSSSDLTIGSLTYKIYSFDGEISADKYYNVRSVYSTSIDEAANQNVTLNSRALDFQLTIQATEGATVGESSLVVFDTSLVANGLSVLDSSNSRDATKFWTYYSIDDSGTINALNYDPIKNAGAKFYDTSGDGIADSIHLELVDGGYGDKDGEVNGVIKDPSAAGTATLNPDFVVFKDQTNVKVVDSENTSTSATFVLNASLDLTTRTSSVDEIGYAVIEDSESSFTIDILKTKAKTLFNTLEDSDVTLTTTTNDLYNQELFIANNQNLLIYKVSDASITDITSLDDSRISYFKNDTFTSDTTTLKTADGMSLSLSIASSDPGIDELIGNLQSEAPVLDFASVPEKLGSITGTLEYAREADFDSVIGFYKVLNSSGDVLDSVTGNVVSTSASNYSTVALRSSNLVTELADISIADDQTATKNIIIEENSIIAPYALSNGETLFAFGDANSDAISHFKSFGTNSFGLEDMIGGGDKDYDDFIVKFDFNSVTLS